MGVERKPNFVHFCCAVPYRHVDGQIEFCLVVTPEDRSWEFPQVAVPPEACGPDMVLEQARLQAGLYGFIDPPKPLGQYASSRGDTAKQITAFLMRVDRVDDLGSAVGRRRWCRAVEANARIRRKPMRRLIDVAQRILAGQTVCP